MPVMSCLEFFADWKIFHPPKASDPFERRWTKTSDVFQAPVVLLGQVGQANQPLRMKKAPPRMAIDKSKASSISSRPEKGKVKRTPYDDLTDEMEAMANSQSQLEPLQFEQVECEAFADFVLGYWGSSQNAWRHIDGDLLSRTNLPRLLGPHHAQFEAVAAHAFECMTHMVGRDTVSEKEFCAFLRPFAVRKETTRFDEEYDGDGKFDWPVHLHLLPPVFSATEAIQDFYRSWSRRPH